MEPSDRVFLDVGGKHFDTTRSTLTFGSAYFSVLLDGPFDQTRGHTPEKRIFIDRDPDAFTHVLRFLRDNNYGIPPEFVHELDFYQIKIAADTQVDEGDPDLGSVFDKEPPTQEETRKQLFGDMTEDSALGGMTALIASGSSSSGGTPIPSPWFTSLTQNNEEAAAITGLVARPPSCKNDDTLEWDIPRQFDLAGDMFFSFRFVMRGEHEWCKEMRANVVELIQLDVGNVRVIQIPGHCLTLMSLVHESPTVRAYRLARERSTHNVVFRLPLCDGKHKTLPMVALPFDNVKVRVRLNRASIVSYLKVKNATLVTRGVYLGNTERRAIATNQLDVGILQCNKYAKIVKLGKEHVQLDVNLNHVLDRVYYSFEETSTGRFLPIPRLRFVINGKVLFSFPEAVVVELMMQEGLLPQHNTYFFRFDSCGINTGRIDRTELHVDLPKGHKGGDLRFYFFTRNTLVAASGLGTLRHGC